MHNFFSNLCLGLTFKYQIFTKGKKNILGVKNYNLIENKTNIKFKKFNCQSFYANF